MKTIRLFYPDHVSGGLETYYFGARLMQYILPENQNQPLVTVAVTPPNGEEKAVTNGIYAEDEVLAGIMDAQAKIREEKPDKIITIGGNCLVSLAPFDYLHGLYENTGIIWIDAHPDVSSIEDGYPNAHAMVLGPLLGEGTGQLSRQMKHAKFGPDEILYVGLQPLHDYQEEFLNRAGVSYKVQDKAIVSEDEIRTFMGRFEHILVHLDIDALDEHFFHSTYFANPELVGDGSGGGRMTLAQMGRILNVITGESDVVGFTIAEGGGLIRGASYFGNTIKFIDSVYTGGRMLNPYRSTNRTFVHEAAHHFEENLGVEDLMRLYRAMYARSSRANPAGSPGMDTLLGNMTRLSVPGIDNTDPQVAADTAALTASITAHGKKPKGAVDSLNNSTNNTPYYSRVYPQDGHTKSKWTAGSGGMTPSDRRYGYRMRTEYLSTSAEMLSHEDTARILVDHDPVKCAIFLKLANPGIYSGVKAAFESDQSVLAVNPNPDLNRMLHMD